MSAKIASEKLLKILDLPDLRYLLGKVVDNLNHKNIDYTSCKVYKEIFNPKFNKHYPLQALENVENGKFELSLGDWILMERMMNPRIKGVNYKCIEIVSKVGKFEDPYSHKKMKIY
ncbi:MAG: 37S ribosomal protein S17 mitochondrial [Paramarteilia canceri]